MRQKILHIIPCLQIGGAERLLLNVIKLLPEYEHHVAAFGADPGFQAQFSAVATVHLKQGKKIITLSNVLFLKNLEREIKPCIIHAHLLKTNWLSRMAFPGKRNLFNTIHSLYSVDAFRFHLYTPWAERLTYQFSRVALIFVSDIVKQDYQEHITLKRDGFVLENFVTNNFFDIQPVKYVPSNTLKLIAIGNVKPLKNYGLLINAFRQLKDLPIELDIYGEGGLEEFKKEVESQALKVYFKGGVPSIAAVLGNYHALVFPSLYEGFSLSLLEAMAAGIPLILSDISGFQKLVGCNAYYFNPQDPSECASAIQKAFYEGFSPRAMEANKDIVKDNFTEARYKNKLETIYQLVRN